MKVTGSAKIEERSVRRVTIEDIMIMVVMMGGDD